MTDTAFDRDALRAKYRAERDKRLRGDGNDQYVNLVDDFAHYLDDPYTAVAHREPLNDEVTVAVIGGGFAGLITAARLRQAGIDNVRLIDKGGDVGGTWYWNRYPGAQCDTASMIYLPLLEETGHMPTEKYTHAPEILAHCQRIARHFDLYGNAALSTEVTRLDWDDRRADDGGKRWIVHTNRGDRMRAKYVAMGTGPLHRPKLPGIPGIRSFAGHSFHTSRWDYDYTGGDPAGALLDRLTDKRVGIIGTGATAVQCVPHLARAAAAGQADGLGGELFVFQRTPSSIDIRNNHPIDPDWFATLQPGWQKQWRENFTILQTGGFTDEDLVKDGWTDISQRIRDVLVARLTSGEETEFTPEAFERAYNDSDDEKMSEIRARVDALIGDSATAEALKPWYRQLCKRPCFHDQYLQSYNLPGVHLVDTDGAGVERIDESGVWVAGRHYPLDLLIYSTGFEVGTDYARRSGYETYGRDGLALGTHWAQGMRTMHGTHVHGFPNLFIVGPAQGANLISNVPHNLVEAGQTIADVVAHAESVGATEVEVTADAEQAWVQRLAAGGRRFGNNADCTPGYYNNEGQVDSESAQRNVLNSLGFPEGPVAYFQYLDQWRSTGTFDGLSFS
jgi:cation diffusion facilitator CzcD-associated flavoprotein CzcO